MRCMVHTMTYMQRKTFMYHIYRLIKKTHVFGAHTLTYTFQTYFSYVNCLHIVFVHTINEITLWIHYDKHEIITILNIYIYILHVC